MIASVFAAVDPTTPTFWTVLPSFGIAGACLVLAYFFLEYLKSEGKRRDELEAKRDARYEEFTKERSREAAEMADRQSEVIRDNTAAMREFRAGVHLICRAAGESRHDRRTTRGTE